MALADFLTKLNFSSGMSLVFASSMYLKRFDIVAQNVAPEHATTTSFSHDPNTH